MFFHLILPQQKLPEGTSQEPSCLVSMKKKKLKNKNENGKNWRVKILLKLIVQAKQNWKHNLFCTKKSRLCAMLSKRPPTLAARCMTWVGRYFSKIFLVASASLQEIKKQTRIEI